MRFSILLTASLMVVFAATPRTQSHDVRLRAAQQKETVDGDPRAAITLYRQLADDRTTPPEIAAKAILQIGRCYERLGNNEVSEARKAYERVVAQYAGQSASVAEAKTRLAALGLKPTPAGGTVALRRVRSIDGVLPSAISQDGRIAAVLQGSRLNMVDLETGRSEPLTSAGAVESSSGLAVSPDARFVAIGIAAGARPVN
jgi:hypothetical protein